LMTFFLGIPVGVGKDLFLGIPYGLAEDCGLVGGPRRVLFMVRAQSRPDVEIISGEVSGEIKGGRSCRHTL